MIRKGELPISIVPPSNDQPSPQLVEWRHVEPGSLVAGRVEVDAHGVLLQQRRLALVHGQVLVRLQVKQLQFQTASLPPAAFCHRKNILALAANGDAWMGE